MRFGNALREVFYGTMVLAIVGGLWMFAWAKSLDAEANRRWWPAKDPALFRRLELSGNAVQELPQ